MDVGKGREHGAEASFVIPAHDCKEAGGRATQGAVAEAGIQATSAFRGHWIPRSDVSACAGMTALSRCHSGLIQQNPMSLIYR